MRKYPIDSPRAQARLVAVALLADGALDRSEIELLDRKSVVARLGLDHDEFDSVLHEFCNDILQYGVRNDCGELQLGREAIDAMLDEITRPALQRRLLRLIHELIYADRCLSAGEAVLASQAMARWNIDLHEVTVPRNARARRWPPRARRAPSGVTA